MNGKLYQIGGILNALAVIILGGFLLFTFMPTIDQFRLDAIADIDAQPAEEKDVLSKILLTGLKPTIWIFWAVLSIFALMFTVRQAQAGGGF